MSKEKGSEIRLVTLSNYVKPKPIVNESKGYVTNGKNNSFYQYIIDCNNGSTTNSSINSSYIDLIYGKGIGAKNALTNAEDWLKFKQVLKDSDLRRIISDFQFFYEGTMQVVKNKKKGLHSIKHIPKNLITPSIVNEDNEIEHYYYSQDWSNLNKNPAEPFSAFGTSADAIEIYNIKPYQAGELYFANPSYFSALQYCEVEQEISNLYINSIKNGLSAGYLIEVVNGINLGVEEKDAFEKQVKKHLTGSSNASQFILCFNGVDTEVKVTPFPVNENIHKQWNFLNENAIQKILTAHRATSPSLVGIISSSGFSNTADEMDMAEQQLMKRVIAPKQQYILDALQEILVAYDINLDLYFKPLTEVVQAPTQLSNQCNHEKKNVDLDEFIALGEDEDLENFEIADECEVDYDEVIQLASTGTARPNANSEQDSENIKIRYRYVGNPTPERSFCQKMMNANKVYRKEDIIAMENKPVNAGWGLNGANTYSIWLYKGGGACKHKWNRIIYLKKGTNVDANSPLAETISTSKARQKGFKVPTNDSKVSITPNNMPNKAFVNK